VRPRLAAYPNCLCLQAPLLGSAAAHAAPPVPQNQAELAGLEAFSGRVAAKRPVRAPRVPAIPSWPRTGGSNVHNDAYQTDTYRNLGPLGRRMRIFSASYDGAGGVGTCGITIAFDRSGRGSSRPACPP
jgi:hypothetical protein